MVKLSRPRCPNQSALRKGNYKHPDNKSALKEAGFDKCMYCESKISQVYFGDVEHIKPKSKFPELEFDWNNLGYACAKCNGAKGTTYYEKTPFINPYNEGPDNHIVAFGSLIKSKQGSERGEMTIKEIDLNRCELVERRHNKIEAIQKAINSCFRTEDSKLKTNALEELKN